MDRMKLRRGIPIAERGRWSPPVRWQSQVFRSTHRFFHNDAKARASGWSASRAGSRGVGKEEDMNITLQRRCQPGINCLRTLSCEVRMKTTHRSPNWVTEARPTSRRDAACRVSRRAQRNLARRGLARTAKAGIREQQMLGANHRLVFGKNQRAFDHVLQFANVPAPGLH